MTQIPADATTPTVPANAQATAATQHYLRAKVLTATPEQLQLMLYDGAIRFAESAKTALGERKFDRSYEALTKAQNIVAELKLSLRPEVAPEACGNLAKLYDFAFMRLVHANMHQDAAAVEEALGVLRYQRETWLLLMKELTRSRDASPAALPSPERLSVAA